MTNSTFGGPTQFETTRVAIDGEDIAGLFLSISIFEDIYRPCVTGNITLTDSDGATAEGSFIEKNNIEFIEPISLQFKNANGETLQFEGVLNGLRNEYIKSGVRFYTVDFTSNAVRENEKQFVTESFRDTSPQAIVQQMIQKVGGTLQSSAQGKNMQYLGSRRRPLDIVKYVCTHGLSQQTEATEVDDEREEEAKGSTGFLCWETTEGYNFETIDDVLAGKSGTEHRGYRTILANNGRSMEELMRSIVQVDFDQIGDFQTKLRSGAFGGRNISFDPDSGIYKEYTFYNDENMTEKQKQYFGDRGTISRIFMKINDNQKFTNECQKAQPLTGDQSRAYLLQNAGRQNTFSDQTGHFTLYPSFSIKAGDTFECKVNKVKGERSQGDPDKKHSGRYVVQAVGHHFFADGTAYTKLKTIRSTIQQNEPTSTQV